MLVLRFPHHQLIPSARSDGNEVFESETYIKMFVPTKNASVRLMVEEKDCSGILTFSFLYLHII
jgi:hypothetical protein